MKDGWLTSHRCSAAGDRQTGGLRSGVVARDGLTDFVNASEGERSRPVSPAPGPSASSVQCSRRTRGGEGGEDDRAA